MREFGERLKQLPDAIVARLRRKGQERLTIMLIPHGQDRMFSLQLNWYMIVFLTGLLCGAMALAVSGVYNRRMQQHRIDELHRVYGARINYAFRVQDNADQMVEHNYELRDAMHSVGETLGIPDREFEILPGLDRVESFAEDNLEAELQADENRNPGERFMPPVYALRTAAYFLVSQDAVLRAIHESTTEGLAVYNEMPMRRPFASFEQLRDSSGFGSRLDPITGYRNTHTGFDTSGPVGTEVYATGNGVVHKQWYDPYGYGRAIIIEHEFGFYSLYGHLSRTHVQTGDEIKGGQLIGAMGNTGRSTGTHLHYEIRLEEQGNMIDPLPFFCSMDFRTSTCLDFNRGRFF